MRTVGKRTSSSRPPRRSAALYRETGSPDVAVELTARRRRRPAHAWVMKRVTPRTLVMFGDDDEVKLEHAVALYRAMPNREWAIIPGTSHGLLVEKPDICNSIILDFLCNEPVQFFAPIRRASASLGTPSTIDTAPQ